MKTRISIKAIGALALIFGLTAAFADNNYPPREVLAGHWWQWGLGIPAAMNPITDATGEFAAVGQSGPVWFLAGNFGGATERTITVPAGKAIFFPILNQMYGGYLPSQGYPAPPLAWEREQCKAAMDQATDMFCEVDGVAIAITEENRVQSNPFAVRLPKDNLFQAAGATIPAAVDDGYYVFLEPLAAGEHVIRFAGTAAGGFHLEVTYHITVK